MRTLLLIVALLLISTSAFSRKTQFGIKGGLNLANITNSGGNYKPSIYLGGFVDIGVSNSFSIQPELIYSRQGTTNNEGGIKVWIKMDYINIPVMFKIYFGDAKRLSLDFGPQVGLLINSKAKVKQGGTSVTVDLDEAGMKAKNIDFSIAVGLSYVVKNKIDLSFRTNMGITSILRDTDSTTANSVFQLGVGYRF